VIAMFLRFLVALLVFPITLAQGSPHNNLPLQRRKRATTSLATFASSPAKRCQIAPALQDARQAVSLATLAAA